MAFKNFATLEQFRAYLLQQDVDISIANLSRYINGKALPKSKLKEQLLSILVNNAELGLTIDQLIESHISVVESENNIAINNTHLLNDSKQLVAILFIALRMNIIQQSMNKVLTAEVDGIPVGMALARLLNIDCVYARRKKPIGTEEFYYADIYSHSSGRMDTLYLPEKFIRKGEPVLIIDDIVRSGATQRALANLVEQAGGKPVGIVSIIGIGEHWKNLTEYNGIPISILKVYTQSQSNKKQEDFNTDAFSFSL